MLNGRLRVQHHRRLHQLLCLLEHHRRPRRLHVLGIEAHKFFSFGTIADRVQLGLNIAGGMGSPRGTFEQTSTNESTLSGPPGFPPQTFSSTDTYTSPAEAAQRLHQARLIVEEPVPQGTLWRCRGLAAVAVTWSGLRAAS